MSNKLKSKRRRLTEAIYILRNYYYHMYLSEQIKFTWNDYLVKLKYQSDRLKITGKLLHKLVRGDDFEKFRKEIDMIHEVFGTTDSDIIK